MIYALDTNIISYAVNGDMNLCKRIETIHDEDSIVIPLFVYYEALRGLLKNHATKKLEIFRKLKNKLKVVSMTQSDITVAAQLYADRINNGNPMDDGDILIAAQAISRGYTLITHNVKHFKGIDGLVIEDWV